MAMASLWTLGVHEESQRGSKMARMAITRADAGHFLEVLEGLANGDVVGRELRFLSSVSKLRRREGGSCETPLVDPSQPATRGTRTKHAAVVVYIWSSVCCSVYS